MSDTDKGGSIVLDGLTFGIGDFSVAFDTAFESGGLHTVTGPSGAGKSTLLNLIAGLETPKAGHIRIGGTDVTRRGPPDRPVSMVFQDNNLFAHLDVRTNIGLGIDPGLKLGTNGWQAADAALERVGLSGYGKRRPGQLSGGERQRVALARGLVRKQPVLLLDEPFAALGPGLKADMLSLVRDLHAETGMTVLMVTHDPCDAMAIASHVVFVRAGRIAASGRAKGFFERSDIAGLAAYLGKDDT